MVFINKSKGEPIACPYCGKRTVVGTVLIKYSFKSEHSVFTDGIELDGESFGEFIESLLVNR